MLGNVLSEVGGATLIVIGAILPVVNPLGDAPIFLMLTAGSDEATRRRLAKRIACYSFTLLLGSMLFGSYVLRLFGLSVEVVQVAGSLIVCAIGWRLLADDPKPTEPRPDEPSSIEDGAFYPLTMPVTIDPGVLAVAIAVGANHGHSLDGLPVRAVAAFVGCSIVAMCILLTYHYAHRLAARIGRSGMLVLVRLSAFIVLSIGVQIGWTGIQGLAAEAASRSAPSIGARSPAPPP